MEDAFVINKANRYGSREYSVDVGVVEKRGANREGKTEGTQIEIDFTKEKDTD